jgi:hypothetical protein
VDFEFSYIFQQNGTVSYCNLNTGINLPVVTAPVNIFPNPAGDYLVISGCDGAEITITGLEGSTMKKIRVTGENHTIDITDIKTGTYLLLINLNSFVTCQKLVIVR